MTAVDDAWLVLVEAAMESALGMVVAGVDTGDASGTDVAVRSVSAHSPGCDGTVPLSMLPSTLGVVPLTAWGGSEIWSTTTAAFDTVLVSMLSGALCFTSLTALRDNEIRSAATAVALLEGGEPSVL